MNITFDPMTEAAAVRRMLDALLDQDVTIGTFPMIDSDESRRAFKDAVAGPSIAELQNAGHLPASAVPLPPAAPSTAAADVFPTAPEVPTPGAVTPPPVPVPPVPTAPTPAVPSAPAGATSPVAVDKNGLPWDERIHSGSKEKNKDGSWRQRRGTEPDYVTQVEDELRALLNNITPVAPVSAIPLPPTPPVSTTPQTVPPVTPGASTAAGTSEVPNAAPASSAVPTAPIPTPPVPPVPTAPASTATPISFAQVMTKVTELHRAGKVVDADVHGALAAVGLGPNEIGKLAKQDEATAVFRQTVATILDDIAGGA